jgi:c-di-AMP phosphodiesterase-like protein
MVDADDLLKIVLILVIVWIALEILETVISFLAGPLSSIIGLLIVVLIVLFLLDRI